MTKASIWTVLAMTLALAACGQSDHAGHGDVVAGEAPGDDGMHVTAPWSREIPPNAPVAAGFLSIHNGGGADDRLVEVRSDASVRVEIHEVRHEDGMARMRELGDGLPLPAGATVELKPGGYHLMFITPVEGRFAAGNRVAATLVFEQAGAHEVAFEVRPVDADAPAPADAHSHH
ncbi:copper chaperone PCu(A)C [Luteimonas aestuarii]|uniref:Copper chaperone PCu(A)C n=1 Tax=Luteimonas aestuarii TaxID=453837 RepID=A0A4R5TS89_9GAMM|nr:copper chaperone PCu(A)C [Luteimonas aestuarii]TDK22735.1 copper chaperone PCu(A)C [Luteimonas aestuarii]